MFARELRQRMRGPRAAVILTLYLLFLVLVVQLLYAAAGDSSFDGPGVESTAALGRTVFQTLLFFVLALVCFIVPGVTAGAISGERARQTLVPLQITLLKPRSILVGKLLASLAFVVLLIVATLPVAGVSFLLGGVEPTEVVRATGMVLVVAVVLGSLSLLCSTYLRGSQGATVVALAFTFVLCVGTFMAYGIQRLFNERQDQPTSQLVLVVNPFMAVADVLDDGAGVGNDDFDASPFTPMKYLLDERGEPRNAGVDEVGAGFGPAPVVVAPATIEDPGGVARIQIGDQGLAEARAAQQAQLLDDAGDRVPLADRAPFWLESLVAYALIVVGSIALAARRLALPRPNP
ncbi:MAG TPA: ABC transporter permease [Acidimicrobiales bacterium]|nr:ABC transporter permease [Acidimicrobiales bacterium]